MIQESQLLSKDAKFRETIAAGDYWIYTVKARQTFRIVDLKGNQAADTLFFNASDPEER